MNNTALAVRTDSMDDLTVIREQAALLLKSGFLPQAIKTPEQALAIIITGRELGIGAMAALNNIAVIQGKPTVSPQLMLALIHRSGQLEDMAIEAGKDGAKCLIKRKGKAPYVARFGPAEAAALGLSQKDNYKKQPATMYKWRAVAEACRFTFSDVILGLYTHDEMGAQTDAETGELVEAPADPAQPSEVDDYEAVLNDAIEPDPARPVKLEGAQPTDSNRSDNKTVNNILVLAGLIGWDGRTLAGEVQRKFKTAISDEHPASGLEEMPAVQLKELLQVLQAEKRNRERMATA